MNYKYKTRGTCSREISFELENGIVKNVSFYGGCNGNLKGIAALVEGKKAEEIIPLIKGIKCGFKPINERIDPRIRANEAVDILEVGKS